MLRIFVLVLCMLVCSAATAREVATHRAATTAPRAAEADAYRRDDGAVAPVARYRARQEIADDDYLGAALDDDDGSGDGGDGNGDYGNAGNGNGSGYVSGNGYGNGYGDGYGNSDGNRSARNARGTNPYAGDGGASFGTFSASDGSGSVGPGGAVTFKSTYKSAGIEPAGCVYKAVMTDAEIATCKAASMADMRRTGVK